eukprot:gene28919-32113_t
MRQFSAARAQTFHFSQMYFELSVSGEIDRTYMITNVSHVDPPTGVTVQVNSTTHPSFNLVLKLDVDLSIPGCPSASILESDDPTRCVITAGASKDRRRFVFIYMNSREMSDCIQVILYLGKLLRFCFLHFSQYITPGLTTVTEAKKPQGEHVQHRPRDTESDMDDFVMPVRKCVVMDKAVP